MVVLFLISAAVVFYTYLGYPLLLSLLPQRPPKQDVETPLPSVSVLLCAHNAEGQIRGKLENLNALEYPRELLEIIVVCDGCTDRTPELARSYRGQVPVRVLELREHAGKAVALNQGRSLATGEVLFMVDVRQRIGSIALKHLARHFADPGVGAVSGELIFVDDMECGKPVGVGVYWKFEKLVRKLESLTGNVVGATGAIYAVRGCLVPALPANLILDDVYIPMHVVKAGKRVLFESRATATDNIVADHSSEFSRKVRTLYGNLQLVELAPWLVGPGNPSWVRFVSHKLLRIVVPVPLLLMLISSIASRSLLLNVFFWTQLGAYSLAAFASISVGPAWLNRVCSVARTFLLLNVASIVAMARYVARRPVVWTVTKIEPSTPAANDEVVHA